MSQDSQDIGKESADQMGSIGKKAGGKLARKGMKKLAKLLKKLLVSILKKIIASLLKVLFMLIGPWGCLIIIVCLLVLTIMAAIPFSDWFLKGGERTEEQVQADESYEQEFKDLANASVTEVDGTEANDDWKANFKDAIKPSWGIPAALVRYYITNEDRRDIELPDPGDKFEGLEPTFNYETVDDDNETRRTQTFCTWEEEVETETEVEVERNETSYQIRVRTTYKECREETTIRRFFNPLLGRFVFLTNTQVVCNENPERTEEVTINAVNKPNLPEYPTYQQTDSRTEQTSYGYDEITYEQSKITSSELVTYTEIQTETETVTRSETSEETDSFNREARDVMSKVETVYGDFDVPHLTRYYPGGSTSYDLDAWEVYSKREYEDGGKTCSETVYRQYEHTTVDDRGVPMIDFDDERLKNILISKDVKEDDIKLFYEFVAAADEEFDPAMFSGGSSQGSFVNGNYDYDGPVIDGWVWPVPANRKITDTYGYQAWRGGIHYGLDMGGSAANGTPIIAAQDGLVLLAQWSDSYGNWIILSHDNDLTTRYAHMSALTVGAGEQVEAGDQIGVLGTSGESTGPHLHFEVLKTGTGNPLGDRSQMEAVYDPMIFLEKVLEEEGN